MCIALASIVIIKIRKEAQQSMVNMEILNYAMHLEFGFRFMYFGFNEDGFNLGRLGNPNNWHSWVSGNEPWLSPPHEFVLVHNADEAELLPNHIIAAWPHELNYHHILGRINWEINLNDEELRNLRLNRNVINLNNFGLSFPLTTNDLVDNWESVLQVLAVIDPVVFRNVTLPTAC